MSKSKSNAPPMVTPIDRPKDLLPAEPTIANDDDANLAFRELAFMEAHAASVSHNCDAHIALLRQAVAEECRVKFGDEFVTYAERAEQLRGALERFADKTRPELKTANRKKSEELRHGTIGWKTQPASVAYVDGWDQAKSIEAVDKATAKLPVNKGGLIKRVAKLAESLLLLATGKTKRRLALLVDLKPVVSLTRAKSAIESKSITAAQLKRFGLEYKPGVNQFYAKPGKYETK